jgi:lysophospholipase L1-like esterase
LADILRLVLAEHPVQQSAPVMTRSVAFLCAVLLLGAVAAADAQAQNQAAGLEASTPQIGWVSLRLTGTPGATVTVTEITAAGPVAVGSVVLPAAGVVDLPRAAPWRCDTQAPSFQAVFAFADGTARTLSGTVHTPTCAGRLTVALRPPRPRARRAVAVRVSDRWGLGGVQATVCDTEPGRRSRRCVPLTLAPGQPAGTVTLHPRRPGRHRLSVTAFGVTLSRTLIVRRVSRRLRVLATGDSMIQIIDGDLKRRLARRGPISVRSDAHISSGISKPFMFDWLSHARAYSRSVRPDLTVMFIGANDGFPMGTPSGAKAPCCDAAWVREYARRARSMMRSYARRGSGTVYWLLLPTPRSPRFRAVFGPVNAALRMAAQSLPGTVRLIDLGRTFTPGGRFRARMRWHGKLRTVRQADGVHLSVAGASIATELIMRRMRRDGLLR